MPGNLAGHWHHYMAGGPASLLELVPFLLLVLLFVLLAAGSWGRRQADALPSKRKPPAVSPPALTSDTHTVRPVLASDLEREEATRCLLYTSTPRDTRLDDTTGEDERGRCNDPLTPQGISHPT